jgi:PadR family transcriptional regulator, regulatory protein PadR
MTNPDITPFLDFRVADRNGALLQKLACIPISSTLSLTFAILRDYNVEKMKVDYNLGEWEQIVLLAVMRCEDNAYGVPIRNEICICTGREPVTGALYTTLDRLEEKGLLRSKLGLPTAERGGRARRYFTVTSQGKRAVVRAQSAYRQLLEGLELFKERS